MSEFISEGSGAADDEVRHVLTGESGIEGDPGPDAIDPARAGESDSAAVPHDVTVPEGGIDAGAMTADAVAGHAEDQATGAGA